MDKNFNRVLLCGTVADSPTLSHSNHDLPFYRLTLSVPRLSGSCDELPVLLSGPQLQACGVHTGDTLSLTGQLRSYNNRTGQGRRLVLSVLAHTIAPGGVPQNIIQLSGTLCKAPTLRSTPLGRDICDILLAVNRRYGRADYLPCIAWGAVAQAVSTMSVGQTLTVEGRIQSRCYTKAEDGHEVQHTAYEVSVMRPAQREEFLL